MKRVLPISGFRFQVSGFSLPLEALAKWGLLLALFSPLSPFTPNAHAQEFGASAATYVEISDKTVPDGSIVSFSSKGYHLSAAAYDPTMYGVVTENPAVTYEDKPGANSHAVVNSGKVMIRVTAVAGIIKSGNLVTTSPITGTAQRADNEGYVLGTALEDMDVPADCEPKNKESITTEAIKNYPNKCKSTIWVNINFGFNSQPTSLRSNLLQNLNLALTAPFQTPGTAFRYGISLLSVIIGLIVSILFFGRISANGIQAVGRNPLASKMIIFSVILNIVLALVTLSVAVTIAYFILTL